MDRYNVITTVDIEQQQLHEDGTITIVVIPAGSVINTVVWDGVAGWAPGDGLRAVREDSLAKPPPSAPVLLT